MIGAEALKGFGFGVLVAGFWFGVRHGIDWDHIAAISDITSSQEERRSSLLFGTLYALGHAAVVLVLGVLAIVLGERLPPSVDEVMARVVGITLVVLGVYVFVSLIRHGRDFRLRSRWMLIFSGVRRGVRWARSRAASRSTVGAQAAPPILLDEEIPVSSWHHGHHGRPGHHHHAVPEPDDPFMSYGRGTAFGVGMIHGVGGETPTQVVLFLTVAGTTGALAGVTVLLAFIVGLLASNSLITVGSSMGYLHAGKNFKIYATVAIVTAVFSLSIGILFLLGKETFLPALFGG